MRLKIRNRPDFWAGVLFVCAGLAFGLGAQAYPIGRAGHMGAGYFPALLGLCLALLVRMMLVNVLHILRMMMLRIRWIHCRARGSNGIPKRYPES